VLKSFPEFNTEGTKVTEKKKFVSHKADSGTN
jgi:hypothetical protein